MIARIIEWSARNRMFILLATLFIVGAGVYAVLNTPLDAIPDLSDPQVIVYTEYPGQAPQVVEDQVTYPLTTALLAVPKSKVVRGFSFFGVSFVYVVFEDGTDIYWARSRVLEYLNFAQKRLPAGVTPSLGPGRDRRRLGVRICRDRRAAHAGRTALDPGLVHPLPAHQGGRRGGGRQRRRLRQAISGRGRSRKLRAYGIPLTKITDAIRASNMDVGGSTIEMTEREYMVRGRGYLKGAKDLEQIVLKSENGTPVLLRDVARVELGPDERRGLTELNGQGEVVSGIVLQRDGENALVGHQERQAEDRRDRGRPAQRRVDRAGL